MEIESKIKNSIRDFDIIRAQKMESRLKSLNGSTLDMDDTGLGQTQEVLIMNESDDGRQSTRVIVITVCLSKKITEDKNAYLQLINQLKDIQSQHLRPDDFVLYNIGSPYG